MLPPRIPVSLHTSDAITRAGLTSQLRVRPEVRLLDDADTDSAQVAVIVADHINEPTLQALRALHIRSGVASILVATHIDDGRLAAAVEHGAKAILRRHDATPDRLVTTIRATAAGEGTIPPDLLGRLLHQFSELQHDVLAPRGLTLLRLTQREIEVLRLVADGYNTTDIANKLHFSHRTIKYIIHEITNRFHLRNRCHAVAYALRNGLI